MVLIFRIAFRILTSRIMTTMPFCVFNLGKQWYQNISIQFIRCRRIQILTSFTQVFDHLKLVARSKSNVPLLI